MQADITTEFETTEFSGITTLIFVELMVPFSNSSASPITGLQVVAV